MQFVTELQQRTVPSKCQACRNHLSCCTNNEELCFSEANGDDDSEKYSCTAGDINDTFHREGLQLVNYEDTVT